MSAHPARLERWAPAASSIISSVDLAVPASPLRPRPVGLALNDHGDAFVVDALNRHLVVYSQSGTFLRTIGQPGRFPGTFTQPRHVAIGPDGTVLVVDTAFQCVQMFDGLGRLLMLFPSPSPGTDLETAADADPPRSALLTLPAGICTSTALVPFFARFVPDDFDVSYLIFVSDQLAADPIKVYGVGTRKRAETMSLDE